MIDKIINEEITFVVAEDLTRLSELKQGYSGIVYEVNHSIQKNLLRLYELGFVPGKKVEMIRTAPFGDPIEVKLLKYRLSIRKEDAKGILLEQVSKKEKYND